MSLSQDMVVNFNALCADSMIRATLHDGDWSNHQICEFNALTPKKPRICEYDSSYRVQYMALNNTITRSFGVRLLFCFLFYAVFFSL